MSSQFSTVVNLGAPTSSVRRSRTRKLSEEEKQDWDAVDRALREISEAVSLLKKAVVELQEKVGPVVSSSPPTSSDLAKLQKSLSAVTERVAVLESYETVETSVDLTIDGDTDLVVATVTGLTITLPAIPTRDLPVAVRCDVGTLNVFSSDLIEGSDTFALNSGETGWFAHDGTTWRVISQ